MPTTYAHDLFGRKVYQRMDQDLQEIIQKEKALFLIGLHGPDILFYYEPFHKNAVSSLGSRMHNDIAADFFVKGKQYYLETRDEKVLSYLCGFICHYMLDSSCHPYIGEYMKKSGATHDEIETDFDRYLMENSGKKPFSYHPGKVLQASAENAELISSVIGEVSASEVKKALKGMRLFTGITVGGRFHRGLILKGAKLLQCYPMVQGRIMRQKHLSSCAESTKELAERFSLAIPETVTVMREFYQDLFEPEKINARFYRNYE